MNIWRDFAVCPYDKNHVIRNCNVQNHILTCKQKHQNAFSLTCRFNCQRLCQEDQEFLCKTGSENIRSKSKRRRDRIRERRVRRDNRAYFNEPQNSNLKKRAVKMDNKQDLWDWEGGQGDLGDSVKRRDPKNDSNGNAEPPQEAADQRSKTAKKRSQKKQRKEKGTGDNVPADESDEKKKFVIKLKESVIVTETVRPRREVFIHYPTKRLLSPDNVPTGGLNIQPMMLQRICFEAFIRMQSTSGGERNKVTPLTLEQERRALRFFHSFSTNGDTLSANEDENKTTQDSSETASGVTPSVIKKENKTTQASDANLNAELYYPKRYKPKKDKKKCHPKATAPRSAAKPPPPDEIPLEDRFVKYMLFDDEEMPPPKARPDKHSFPVPYMENDDPEMDREREKLKNPVKFVDCDIRPYLREDEWPDEKEEESTDEN